MHFGRALNDDARAALKVEFRQTPLDLQDRSRLQIACQPQVRPSAILGIHKPGNRGFIFGAASPSPAAGQQPARYDSYQKPRGDSGSPPPGMEYRKNTDKITLAILSVFNPCFIRGLFSEFKLRISILRWRRLNQLFQTLQGTAGGVACPRFHIKVRTQSGIAPKLLPATPLRPHLTLAPPPLYFTP